MAQTARRLRAVAGLPPHREPLGPRINPAPALSLRRGSAGRHSGWRARPRISAQAVVVWLAKMSAKPAVGFVNEASQQILAGGSAGKAAPPGASRFSLRVFRKRFSDKSPHRSFAFFLCLPRSRGRACRARARGAREQRRPGAGGGRRAAGVPCPVSQVKSPRRPRWPLSGSPPSVFLACKARQAAPRPATWRRPFCLAGYFILNDPVGVRLS